MGLEQERETAPASRVDDRLLAILGASRKVNSERDREALLDLIAQEATRLMGADRASIFLLDRQTNELWSKVALGSDEVLRFDARLGIAGAIVKTGETINVGDVQTDPRFYATMDAQTGYRTLNLLAVPLRKPDGEIFGVFEVLNKRVGVFTEADEEILGVLAGQAAVALETAEMVRALRRDRDSLAEENTQLWKDVEGRFSTRNILGTSEKIHTVVRLIDQISDSAPDVLITGESGTGKELVAKAIHYNSPRARRAFVALNCAALPESLLESELFGIEKGVATGVERRAGKFELAHGGTLFLDEVGDLSLSAQAKVLRALQERVIERLGGRTPLRVDVRILAATNKDLDAEIRKGNFRADLYYRLNVIHVEVPPLRGRGEDVEMLATHFLLKHCRELGRNPVSLAAAALARLRAYGWPGNVRELENEMKRIAVSCRGTTIGEKDLSESIRRSTGAPRAAAARATLALKDAVAELERSLIVEALERCGRNQYQAARMLGLSRQGLINKMKRYGIKSP